MPDAALQLSSERAGASTGRPDGHGRPGWRPRRWAVLAVVLALMALVAALSRPPTGQGLPAAADTPQLAGRHDPGHRSARPVQTPSPPATSHETGAPDAAGTTDLGTPASGAASGASKGGSASTATGGSASHSGGSTGAPTVATTAASVTGGAPVTGGASVDGSTRAASAGGSASAGPAAGAGAGSGTGATAAVPVTTAPSPEPGVGNFEPPTASATWSVPGGGPVRAAASWSGTPELALDIACGAARASNSGSSPLVVTLPSSPAGTCEVTLSEPTAVPGPVSYTVTIDPPPSGGT